MPLVPGDELGPIRDALSQLQVAFAREAQGAPEQAEGGPSRPPDRSRASSSPQPQPERAPSEPRRASKIWTPPGT